MDGFSLRVVLADDHPGMVAGVGHSLSSVGTIQLTGTALNSTELIRILDKGGCDVLVSDYSMPGNEHGDGIAFFAFLQRRYPSLKLVVLTMLDNPAVLGALRGQGIRCIVSKSDAISYLIPAIHAAATGGTYYSPSIQNSMRVRNVDTRTGLTERLKPACSVFFSPAWPSDINRCVLPMTNVACMILSASSGVVW